MNDVKINITKSDKSLLDNLIRLLGRAKFEGLETAEILVASDSLRWLSRLQKTIEADASRPPVEVVNQEPITTAPAKAAPTKRSKKGE